ncbi:short-chain dehydrogenase/reductase [Ilyonectria destructans]|nr:short-chain dehydrogenase/reductase [Ilyonectria destructans]
MAAPFTAGGVAIITGGASGIGFSLAKKCQGYGMRVIIADRDNNALEAATKTLGADVTPFKMDVAQKEGWEALRKTVNEKFDARVNLLALNAGMGRKASWDDASAFQDTFNVNIMGVVNGIAAFLPLVERAASDGNASSIVITGSKQGITNPPGNPAYNASKAAVKSIAEHLSWDLRDRNVSVHLLVPGWTFTGMTGNAPNAGKTKPDGAWWPDQVVEYLEKKMQEGQFWVICPDNDVTEALDRKRMLWTAGDMVEGRPPLTRWREDWKDKAKEAIDTMEL